MLALAQHLTTSGKYAAVHLSCEAGEVAGDDYETAERIVIASLRLGDFTPAEVRELYAQHTAETGQVFTEEALARAITVTAGQPWLVNALAREVVDEMAVPPAEENTATHVEQARERLILARATHLDQLGLAKGVLVIFDRRREAKGIAKKARFETAVTPKGRTAALLRA